MNDIASIMQSSRSNRGESLHDISHESAILLTFLRHFGCVFCQETTAELARLQRPLEISGVRLAFVHMEPEAEAAAFFAEYGLGDVHRFEDPDRILYSGFELERGRFMQVWGPRVFTRATWLVLTGKQKLKAPTADTRQMPGQFLIHRGVVERYFRPDRISDRADLAELADCNICDIDFEDAPTG